MKSFKEFIEEIGFTNDNFLNTGVVDLMVKLQIDYAKYVKLNLPEVGVTFKDKKTPTFEEWYDDIYTQMYLKESAFKKYFEMSGEELLLRYKKKFKIKP